METEKHPGGYVRKDVPERPLIYPSKRNSSLCFLTSVILALLLPLGIHLVILSLSPSKVALFMARREHLAEQSLLGQRKTFQSPVQHAFPKHPYPRFICASSLSEATTLNPFQHCFLEQSLSVKTSRSQRPTINGSNALLSFVIIRAVS